MTKSTLGRVLDVFANNRGPLTMNQIARDLNISQPQLESMIQYWVRKGKLRQTASYSDCTTCGCNRGDCPFVMELPTSYELVTEDSMLIPLTMLGGNCSHRS